MTFPRAIFFVRTLVVLCSFGASFAFAQSMRVNPCVDGQGKPVGRRGVVTGCMCDGLIYEINSTSNPCWKSKPSAKTEMSAPAVIPNRSTPTRPVPVALRTKTDTLLTTIPSSVPSVTPTVLPSQTAIKPVVPVAKKPTLAKKSAPQQKPVGRSHSTGAIVKPVVQAPSPSTPEPRTPTPIEQEIAINQKIAQSLRQEIRKNESCPKRESDYDQIRSRLYDLIHAGAVFNPRYAQPLVGKQARWCAWNPTLHRAIQGLISCKNQLECSVKCVTSRFIPGMSIDIKYVTADRRYRMVGTSACVAWSKSWRDENDFSGKLLSKIPVGDLQFYPIGNGIYYAVVRYPEHQAYQRNDDVWYLPGFDYNFVGLIYLPE